MSHFTVIVVGADPDAQLAPYHEFESTGHVDEHVRSVDITDATRAEYERGATRGDYMTFKAFCTEYWSVRPIIKPGQAPDLTGDEKHGWVEVDDAGAVVRVIQRTNPNAKWDWYSVGGRWSGYFPLRSGGTADQCAWGDVDLARAQCEAVDRAAGRFSLWEQSFEEHEARHGARPLSRADVRKAHPNDLAATNKAYNAQAAISGYERRRYAHRQPPPACPVEEFGFDRDAYLERYRRRALVPFAVLTDGVWHEKGEMGWFANTTNEKPESVWVDHVSALFKTIDPRALVTLVDCHI